MFVVLTLNVLVYFLLSALTVTFIVIGFGDWRDYVAFFILGTLDILNFVYLVRML